MKYRTKYGNRRVRVGDMVFDSQREYRRWLELAAMEKTGAIHDLRRQEKFTVIPAQYVDGKCVERAAVYVADFTYYTDAGEYVVEDAKGYRTPDYVLKRKLMLYGQGIRVREV